ncbi:HAD family hydrolase [Cellulomonas triticagri]|uniref:HAD family phosphatase n=1 Tax=Cellulomonas triticagri TaxID=2483352 RepID=A0A3M2JBI2_9CELL|nr:HAD family phosphatase [Cellulomonas triticagri]RMI09586.1 HAD family phosphatase [Cellulomonas triticagri]
MTAGRPPGAVLWDLDGVLVDTETVLFEAEREAFASHGVTITPEFKRAFVGLGGDEVMAAMADALGVDVDLADLGRRKMAAYAAGLPFLRGFAPTAALVRAFAAAGVPQVVASGSPREAIAAGLHVVGLDDVLTAHVSAAEVAAGKPAPDVFLEAARRVGVEPVDCLVVEDAVPGVLAAKAAGMRCLAIPSVVDPLDERFERADLVVRGGMAAADPEVLLAWALGSATMRG